MGREWGRGREEQDQDQAKGAQSLVCASLREIKRETERKGVGGHLIREEKRRVHSVSCADVCAGDTAISTMALPLPERHGWRTKYVSLIITEGRVRARTQAQAGMHVCVHTHTPGGGM